MEGGRAEVATFQPFFDLFYKLGSMTKEQKQKKRRKSKGRRRKKEEEKKAITSSLSDTVSQY